MVKTLRTHVTPIDGIVIAVAFLAGLWKATAASGIVCACAMATTIAVWRALPFLGSLVEHAQAEAVDQDA